MEIRTATLNNASSDLRVRGVFQNSDSGHANAVLGSYGNLNFQNVEAKEDYILLLGLGEREAYSRERVRGVSAAAIRGIRKSGIFSAVFETGSFLGNNLKTGEVACAIIEGVILGSEFPGELKSKAEENNVVEFVEIALDSDYPEMESLMEMADVGARQANFARRLVNLPANIVTPEYLLQTAETEAEKYGIAVKHYGRADMEKMGMNLLLAVGSGSQREPIFIEMEYEPDKITSYTPHVILIGKGITFDSGGLNIKTTPQMKTMKEDMAGAAVVMSVLFASAMLNLPIRVTGLIPACENMQSGSPLHPGDVVESMNGKTVEIDNTDAEGRLILADALVYADRLKPDYILDIATLTGAARVALGEEIAPLFTEDDEMASALLESAERVDEPLWRMPLWKPYHETLKSSVADIKNVGGRGAGAITASLFLSEFVENTPHAHIDIGGTAFPSNERKTTGKGASGYGVRLLIDFLKNFRLKSQNRREKSK